jgi:hypothetical protein
MSDFGGWVVSHKSSFQTRSTSRTATVSSSVSIQECPLCAVSDFWKEDIPKTSHSLVKKQLGISENLVGLQLFAPRFASILETAKQVALDATVGFSGFTLGDDQLARAATLGLVALEATNKIKQRDDINVQDMRLVLVSLKIRVEHMFCEHGLRQSWSEPLIWRFIPRLEEVRLKFRERAGLLYGGAK